MTVEVTRLASGLSVVTDRMPHLESATLGVWIGSGSRDEKPDEHGISHMLEHMAFKGTKRRSARQIAEEIEAVGGDLNAATSVESTAYYARVLKADVPLALDVLSDILSEPTFDPEELRREQNVIVQEIGATEDAPDDLVFDRLQETAFPKQPVGRSILGTPETVRSFNPASIRGYLDRNYRGPDMLIAAAGAIEHKAIVEAAEKKFASFVGPAGPKPEQAQVGGGTRVETRDLEQVHIALALKGLPVVDPQLYSLQVFTSVLGGGMSSRLFQEAREKRGLCYSIYAFSNGFQDSGFLGVYVGTGEKEAAEISAVIAGEMEAIAGNLTEAEVQRARAQLKVSLLMGMERPGTRAEQIAGQLFALGKVQSAAEIVAQLDAIDAATVKRYAARVMADARPTIAAVGPVARLEKNDVFARRFGGTIAHAAE